MPLKIEREFGAPTAQKKYSDREREDILRDVLDPAKTQVVCGKHQYIGSETPPTPNGCQMCWQAYWIHKIASTPPHLRRERLEEAYRAVYDAVKMYERGEFDFEPFEHAGTEIKTEPDA